MNVTKELLVRFDALPRKKIEVQAFFADAGRGTHMSGSVAVARGELAGTLFSEPTIE